MIDQSQVKHIAKLARLELSDQELERMEHDLVDILAYVDQLKEIDTQNVVPMSHSVPVSNVMRPDVPHRCAAEMVQEMINQAPEREGDHFKVKEILGQ